MKVLVTGASGFIGRHVLWQLEQHNIETVVIGRTRPQNYSGAFLEMDLLRDNPMETTRCAGASHLLHLAWYAEHEEYWTSSLNLRWVDATVRMVEAFSASGGQRIVVAGTCAEYDWTAGCCYEDSTALNPVSLYGVAKDATRRLLAAVCSANQVAFSWGRIFFPYGEGEDCRRLIPSLVEVFKGNRPPFVVNAFAYRDFIHVADVARAFVQLTLSDAEGNFNISSGYPKQIGTIVEEIALAFKGDPHIVLDISKERPGEPKIIFGDNAKLKALGWQPVHSIIDIAASQEA